MPPVAIHIPPEVKSCNVVSRFSSSLGMRLTVRDERNDRRQQVNVITNSSAGYN
jgi:hypothetical protein